MIRALLPLLASCLAKSAASIDGHSLIGPPDAAVTVLDADIESVPGHRRRRLDAKRSFLDHEDFYGFLVAVHPSPCFSDGQPFACTGTLIHVDAFLTSSRCKESFSIGSVAKFVGGGDESSIVRQVSQIRPYKSLHSLHDGSLDLLLVFLESQSSAPSTVWKHATRKATRDDKHGYTSFSHFSGPNLNATAVELASRDLCDAVFPNVLSRSNDTGNHNYSMGCASTKSSGATTAVVGAPTLNDDNSLLGVIISGSCESVNSCTKDTTRLLQFVRISTATDDIERALCDSSQFPLDSCTKPYPARQSSTMGATRRWLAAASVPKKRSAMSRLLTWLRQVLGGSPPAKAPTLSPVKPPTSAPIKPPTRAPVKPPTRAPMVPRPSQFPSFEPTSFTIPPTRRPVPPPKPPITPRPTLPPGRSPIRAPFVAAPASPINPPAGAPWPPPISCMPASPKCPDGRNLMQKFCLTQCVAEENVRRKRKAGWRCGDCS